MSVARQVTFRKVCYRTLEFEAPTEEKLKELVESYIEEKGGSMFNEDLFNIGIAIVDIRPMCSIDDRTVRYSDWFVDEGEEA